MSWRSARPAKRRCEDLAYRAPTELVKAFVTNAIQAEKRGTPLVEILRIQADVARTKRFQTAEKVAGRAGVVILMPLMFIFAATVLVMFGSLIVKGFRGSFFDAPTEPSHGRGSRSSRFRSPVTSPSRYPFDQPRVPVGRASTPICASSTRECRAGSSSLERGVGSAGEPRFRITPYESTNPTYVNDRPAVEGTITPGDVSPSPTCAWSRAQDPEGGAE